MICPICGKKNKKNAKFCTKCSAKLKKKTLDIIIIIIIVLSILLLISWINGSVKKHKINSLEEDIIINNILYEDLNNLYLIYDDTISNLKQNNKAHIFEIKDLKDTLNDLNNDSKLENIIKTKDKTITNLNELISYSSCNLKKLDLNFNNKDKLIENIYLIKDNTNCNNFPLLILNGMLSYSKLENKKYIMINKSTTFEVELKEDLNIYSIIIDFYFSQLDEDTNGTLLTFGNNHHTISLIKDQNKLLFKQDNGCIVTDYDINYNIPYIYLIGIDNNHPILYIKDLINNEIKGNLFNELYQISIAETAKIYNLSKIKIKQEDTKEYKRLFELNSIKVYNDFNKDWDLNFILEN